MKIITEKKVNEISIKDMRPGTIFKDLEGSIMMKVSNQWIGETYYIDLGTGEAYEGDTFSDDEKYDTIEATLTLHT